MTESWDKYRADAEKAVRAGNDAEAEGCLFAALQEGEQLPPNDPRLTVSLESLAEFYWNQQKHFQAEVLCRRILKIYENALGKEHIDVAILANNLAMLCHLQKKYIEAEAMYKQTLSIKTRVLGPKHPDVIRVLENYANLLMATHRTAEAEHLKVCAQGITNGRWRRSGTWKAFEPGDDMALTTSEAKVAEPVAHEPVVYEPVGHEPVGHEPVGQKPVTQKFQPQPNNLVDVIDDEVEFRVSELSNLDSG